MKIDEGGLHCSLVRDDKEMVAALKRARHLFDEIYPDADGSPTGALTICQKQMKKKQKNITSHSILVDLKPGPKWSHSPKWSKKSRLI